MKRKVEKIFASALYWYITASLAGIAAALSYDAWGHTINGFAGAGFDITFLPFALLFILWFVLGAIVSVVLYLKLLHNYEGIRGRMFTRKEVG